MESEKPETTESMPQSSDKAPEGNTTSQEMVELHEASREDVKAALKAAQEQESVENSPQDGVSQSTNESPQTSTVQKPLEQPGPQVGAQVPASSPGVAAQGAPPSKPRVYTEEEIQGLIAEKERHKQLGNQKELFIQHRGNELGRIKGELASAKTQLSQIRAQLMNGLEERFHENPVQAVNDRDKIKEIDQQLEGLEQQEERAQKIYDSQTFFMRHVDVDNISVDDVAEVLKADGIDERYVAEFKVNPWSFTTPEALVQMGKRAMDRKNFVQADNDRRILAKHVMYLNSEMQKLKARPGQVMAQVQKHLNQSPTVTSSSSASPKMARDLDPTMMSRAELKAALEYASKYESTN